jgi:hypothetical protein
MKGHSHHIHCTCILNSTNLGLRGLVEPNVLELLKPLAYINKYNENYQTTYGTVALVSIVRQCWCTAIATVLA